MTEAGRPDPDALLAQVAREEAQASRGRLKIFFGASAGVGKTCAMLQAAQTARSQGIDVVIGVVETHGRAETEALVAGIERLPLKELAHRDKTLKEFDLDGALMRKPALVLVDELAHSNGQGSRHPKRWHDVNELLDAGIGVWTTMNVQHLESLNDIVGSITDVRVRETVPDHVFDKANEVVIVDLSPDDLLQRLKEGKVYLPNQAEHALRNFFRKGNLIALRELALRRTADRVDEEMLAYRQRDAVPTVWSTRGSLLACVGPGDHGEKTVRSAARLADQLDVPWHAVYVETPALQRLPDARRKNVLKTLKLAQDLGATTATLTGDNPADPIVKYARQHNLGKIVLGRADRPRRWPWQRVLADHIGMLGSDLDVLQIALPATRRAPAAEPQQDQTRPIQWGAYAKSAAVCIGTTLLATPLLGVFELANIVMLFLLAVLVVAVRYGRGPAVLAAFLSVASFDFFFVLPRFTFAVADVQYVVMFGVMLVVALVIGQLTGGLTYQALVAQRREERVRALYDMSRDLSAALMREQVGEIAARFLSSEFNARSALLVAGDDDRLDPAMSIGEAPDIDQAIAQWCYDKHEPAGPGTDTLTASPTLYLPLSAPMRVRGVLAVQPRDPVRLAIPEQRRLLDTCASLLAISLERIHYVDVAQNTTVQVESERLRNSLLAAISHDLRTPLASLVGLAETMAVTTGAEPSSVVQAETAQAIKEAALRMSSLVNNLLDMARLESGTVKLNREWQPFEEVIGSARKEVASTLQGRSVRVSLPQDLPLVHIDAVLVERVLVNLLENASKYTPPGTPIEISATASGDTIELHVDDRGPGLPRGKEEAIFRKFERGQKESSTPGVGLGLAISRSIAEAHGGALHAANRTAGGARFTLCLPQGEPPSMDALPELAQHE